MRSPPTGPNRALVYLRTRPTDEAHPHITLPAPGRRGLRAKGATTVTAGPASWGLDADAVLHRADQAAVHRVVSAPLLEGVLARGRSGAVFVCGGPGSGKRFSLFGPLDSGSVGQRGMVPRCITEVRQCLHLGTLLPGFRLLSCC